MHHAYQQATSRQSFTPSKRDKYNQYTPRKRYVKEQEELSQYHSLTFGDLSPQGGQEDNYFPRSRQLTSSRRQINRQGQEPAVQLYKSKQIRNYDMMAPYDIPDALEDVTNIVNPRPSLRQQRLNKNIEAPKIANYDENKDNSNIRPRGPRILEQEPLTPRKKNKIQQKDNTLTEKMSALQNKIARLERMTPKRPSTPQNKAKYAEVYPSYEQSRILFDKEQIKHESMGTSQVTAISERQSEILSRVRLGRLVEEEEGQSEIEMIQDLSYKISSKLQSIIRNFG